MTGKIRALAICLMSNGERVLISRHPDPSKGDYFCRPLGGGIEFRERSHDAIAREIREETGLEIRDIKLLGVMENLFEYDARGWHEIVFVFDARFCDATVYERECIDCTESGYPDFQAHWRSLEEILATSDRLVPEGIGALIDSYLHQ